MQKWLQLYNECVGLCYVNRKYELNNFWMPVHQHMKSANSEWATGMYL